MKKFSLLLLLLMASASAHDYVTFQTDVVTVVYNDSCIETANYQYVFINYTSVDKYDEFPIALGVIKEFGNGSVLADIFKYEILV
jgi:hypothetical protein